MDNSIILNNEGKDIDIMQENKSIIIATKLDQELMEISTFDGDIDNGFKEISIGQLNHVLSAIPNALASKTLSTAYKVVMPAGATGPLIQRTTGPLKGLYDTTTKSATGGFGPHAGLQTLNPTAIALGVFTVLSFVTGQYFLAEINKKLTNIKNEIDKLQRMFENKIIAEIKSSIYFIQNTMENLDDILLSDKLSTATLVNIQAKTMILLENSLWYCVNPF
ncbi:hypothetical protein AGMMS49579_08200 [Spirochaetia bacterium]|nr:hypothetical protein AGMMS49579_08200 [Spirochaetia bacterium]